MDSGDASIRDANPPPTLEGKVEPIDVPAKPAPDLSAVRAIYFDLDDTLCAYWNAANYGLRRAFELHGPAGFTAEEMVGHWAAAFREFTPTLRAAGWYEGYLKQGEPTRTEQMRLTLRRVGIVDESRAQALSEAYMRERDGALRLFDDAHEVLARLKERYPLGLITNGPADIQRMEIATLGVEGYFDQIFIEGEMGEGKPNPGVFRRAAEAVGREPHEILFVGNSYAHDVAPALLAGWRAVWVRRASDVPPSSGRMEEKPSEAPLPDAVIENLTELLPLLNLE
jgi:putative hydrolase of the HAD superfamily